MSCDAFAASSNLFGVQSASAATNATITESKITDYAGDVPAFTDGDKFKLSIDWAFDKTPTDLPAVIDVTLPAELNVSSDPGFDLMGSDGRPAGKCVITAAAGGAHVLCTIDDSYVAEHPNNLHGGLEIAGTLDVKNTEEEHKSFPIGDSTTNEITVLPKVEPGHCTENCEYTGENRWKSEWLTKDDSGSYVNWTMSVPAPATGLAPGSSIAIVDTTDDPSLLAGFDPSSVRVQENAVEAEGGLGW
ncbi:hypothetical protein [Pseudoclavibacter sp. 13-3]|uniref:hypothetical protein n=1 Tax=Pseudoclavibacter sp. 13-3 TaxID=2901228 RepID=UPI001E57C0FF|nr:hypothetical protein [Pseudoclavibacter sp. 13-3]MCD7101593.1 hypothetical protein [Pseudoclavibacter sp. 13-3]